MSRRQYGVVYGYVWYSDKDSDHNVYDIWNVYDYDNLSFAWACNECFWLVPSTPHENVI
jgi:hypothetical protein